MQQIFLSAMPDNLHVALLLSHCLVFHHYCRHRLSKKIARKSKASKQALKPSDPASLRPIAIGLSDAGSLGLGTYIKRLSDHNAALLNFPL